jgi:RHS repeat-associated protein
MVRTRTNADTGTVGTTSADFGTTTLGWGPNGHPILMTPAPGSVSPQPITLHWDGDIVLFVTDGNSSNGVVDFKIGLDGEITPRDTTWNGLTAYDRDIAGVLISSTTTSGSAPLSPLDSSDGGPTDVNISPSYNRSGSAVAVYVRPDGFTVAGVQINGVRAFDAALQSWTTPDAFEGDVHDPASQQKYMWNRGNPVDYTDPSGYRVGGNGTIGKLIERLFDALKKAIECECQKRAEPPNRAATPQPLPTGLIGSNPRLSSGKRTNKRSAGKWRDPGEDIRRIGRR